MYDIDICMYCRSVEEGSSEPDSFCVVRLAPLAQVLAGQPQLREGGSAELPPLLQLQTGQHPHGQVLS